MTSQPQLVIDTILKQIDDGTLNPGDVIAEDALISSLGISRTPLREAFLQLEAHGLILRQQRKGAVVFKPTLEEFLCILEVHATLEGQAAALAARRLSRQHGAALEKAVADCATHLEQYQDSDPNGYYQLNLVFHKVVAEASANPFLLDLVKANARKLMAYYRARYRYAGVISASVAEHRRIARLILDRNSEGAQIAMIKHVQFDHVTALDLLAAVG